MRHGRLILALCAFFFLGFLPPMLCNSAESTYVDRTQRGGQEWHKGEDMPITWVAPNLSDNVRVILFKGGEKEDNYHSKEKKYPSQANGDKVIGQRDKKILLNKRYTV